MTDTKYYRTGKGDHRHTSWYCANAHRAIRTGDPVVIPAADVPNWAPCADCCTDADIIDVPVKPVHCDGELTPGNPRRLNRTCVCGKTGAVVRSTGRLRAHLPLNV